MSTKSNVPPTLFITSYLEPEYVQRIRETAGERATVIYEPDLIPPPRYFADHNGEPSFRRTPEQESRWRRHLEYADALLDFPPVSSNGLSVSEMAPRLRWVQTTSAGVGQRVVNLGLQQSNIIVTTASGVHARPLTEFVFMVLLAHFKQLERLQEEKSRRSWNRFGSNELDGQTMAIVGPGKIGRQVATIAKAFGMNVITMGRSGGQERATALGVDKVFGRDGMHQMLSEADVVVLSCPHTPETDQLIDGRAIQAMKDGVVLVNIARGQVVVESALLDALKSRKIAFAGLDVFATEPLPAESEFWDLPNVIINPHSASTAQSENRKITEILCHNLECYLSGGIDRMVNVLDKDLMY